MTPDYPKVTESATRAPADMCASGVGLSCESSAAGVCEASQRRGAAKGENLRCSMKAKPRRWNV